MSTKTKLRKKVLVVSGITFPEIGGVSNYVDFLTNHFSNLEVLSFNFSNPNRTTVKVINNTKYYLLRKIYFKNTKISFLLRIIVMAYFIRKIYKKNKHSLIYAQDVGISGLASLLSFKKYFLRFVGDWAYESYYDKKIFSDEYTHFLYKTHKRFLQRLLSFFIFKRAYRIVTPANHLKEVLIDYYKVCPNKVVIIPNFVHVPKRRGVFKRGAKERYFLFVGRIISLKRLDRLLKAYIIFKREVKGEDIKLYIVGDGFLRSVFEKVINRSDVVFLGSKNKEELYEYISNATAVIIPSNYEGIPFIVLESLYLNTPVIAYKNRGVMEISRVVKDGLLLFKDIKTLAYLLKKSTAKKMRISQPDIVEHFSEEKHIDALLHLLIN